MIVETKIVGSSDTESVDIAVPAPPAEAEAIGRALEAYDDGLVFVFLDGGSRSNP